jgi:hypothetical protein
MNRRSRHVPKQSGACSCMALRIGLSTSETFEASNIRSVGTGSSLSVRVPPVFAQLRVSRRIQQLLRTCWCQIGL